MEDKVPLSDYESQGYITNHDSEARKSKRSKRGLKRRETNRMDKGLKRIDYVLVYDKQYRLYDSGQTVGAQIEESVVKYHDYWKRFLQRLSAENIECEEQEAPDGLVYLKLHTAFERLCLEAERMNLEMPLAGCKIYDDGPPGCVKNFELKHLITDNEDDFVSAPFETDKLNIYKDINNREIFFRPALRSFLTNHILINMDVSVVVDDSKEGILTKKGLPWLKHKGIIKDFFILHDETADDPAELEELIQKLAESGQPVASDSQTNLSQAKLEARAKELRDDPRRVLADTWGRFRIKYQPLWKIRNYFGEKIALYFAWSGTLISTLLLPTLFGIIIFIYGLYLSIKRNLSSDDTPTATDNYNMTTISSVNTTDSNFISNVKSVVEDSISIIKEAFDNEVTPYFALVICLWGTVFLEVWKRKNATLAYEWDVDNFEDTEPDRPEFIGTDKTEDPVTTEIVLYYPMKKQVIKFATSATVLVVMIIVVFISVAAVILYRVFMSVDYCETVDANRCLLVSTVASSVLNGASILLLGRIYEKLAYVLTNWENHRTQTQYDDALVLKLFAFQFANCYSSLFYIAFFRRDDWPNGIFGLGSRYQDSCGSDGNCMSMLSLQVLILMIMKPMPKFFKDILLTWILKKWKSRTWCRGKSNKVENDDNGTPEMKTFLEREYTKPELGDFTLGEYTEKIIVYGFLMLFAASFPLAPLIALLVNLFDMRVDAKRMLWMYRRPLGNIAQDIGMWYNILLFLNVAGVISNGFLIAFTSRWGRQYNSTEQVWIVIIFEHVVFGVKAFIAYMIPDVPYDVTLANRREKYQVAKILEMAGGTKENIEHISATTLVRNKALLEAEQRNLGYLDNLEDESKPLESETSKYSMANEYDDYSKPKKRKPKKKKKTKDDDLEPSHRARLSPLEETGRYAGEKRDVERFAFDNEAYSGTRYAGYNASNC